MLLLNHKIWWFYIEFLINENYKKQNLGDKRSITNSSAEI